jgi:tetratricopeptide (TPR) repeat protein
LALNKRKVLDAARKHAQKGAKAKALKEYNRLLKEDPRDTKLLLEVGDAYRRWGQPEEAITQYSKVAAQYRQDGFDARAVAVFKQILNLDPKHYAAYVSLGELYQRMGLDSEAVAALQVAADGFHKEGKKREALDLLRQMAALDPTNTTSRLKVAELLKQEGMEDDAVAEYQAVATELANQQNREQLIVVQDRILEVRPNHLETLCSQVRQLMAAGTLDRAEPLAVRALNAANEPAQYELLIDLYAQMGHDAKLADATRGLAKLYRERGDDDKARELMQRLPAEDVVAPDARLAVDLSEVEAPELNDDELLDEPFLASDDDFDMMSTNSLSSSFTASRQATTSAGSSFSEQPIDLSLDEIAVEIDTPPATSSIPIPEGDPDQLLAEASVYLRYGKHEQAIASLRGVLAQIPDHRAALEKLGEAHSAEGRSSEAAQAWLKAAEQVRIAGDAEALEILRDRIAALDPALAAQVGQIDPPAAAADSAASIPDIELDVTETDPLGAELDLDVEVELDLDDAIEEVAGSETDPGFEQEASPNDPNDEFEIDLDDDSLVFDETPSTTDAEVGTDGFVADEDFDSFEFEIDADELSGDEGGASAVPDQSGIALEPDAPIGAAAAGTSAPPGASVDEEIEEAEFYIAQDMFDEAHAILARVLQSAPSHARALVLSGEIAAARKGQAAGSATSSPAAHVRAEITEPEFDLDADLGEEVEDETLGQVADGEGEVSFEVEVDEDPAAAADVARPASPAPEALAPAAIAAEPGPTASPASPMPPVADPGDSFDLRAALADVIEEDAAEVANETSGVLSTVEDGFESIFSDFKKGVSATLDEGDFDTRYDLGIAYREMGLFDDAIGEFRVCLDSPTRRFDSLYLMGLCARDLVRWQDAVNHFEQALSLPEIPEERLASVYFDLSVSQEGAGDAERALASVRRVIELEPDFPGAANRLELLESGQSALPEVAAPGTDYESFDELFSDDGDDEAGDHGVAEAIPAETFESFDDLLSDAEAALEEADVVEAEVEEATLEKATLEDAPAAEETTSPGDSKRSGRKKISFV